MAQRSYTFPTFVVGLAAVVLGVAWGETLEFEFDAGNFTNPTTLTNDY